MPAGAAATPVRYTALDALRGLCAIAVCLFHFKATGPIATSAFVRGSWLFVDFFFVLSGFVIACSWGRRLVTAVDARRFALLRFGRIYPLHIVVLLAFLATELAGLGLASAGLMNRQPFDEAHSPRAWLLSAALLQIFGLTLGLSWNHPSWSIAAEFWTYLLFAALLILSGRRTGLALALVAAGSAAMLAAATDGGINVTHQFSLWRCLYGFSVGALVWRWTVDGRRPLGGTAAELAIAALIILFVSSATAAPLNLLAPLLFGLTVHVFAAQSGQLSRLLARPWPQRLGLWSYSIYMVHAFVQSRFDDLLRVALRLGAPALTTTRTLGSRTLDITGTSPLTGTILTLAMLALVIAASAFTHRTIELPGQRWARRRAELQPAA
jgi:peptidoglycan/LPS O-acetylase OafA/YrhL